MPSGFELGASRRALALLRATELADQEELAGVRRVLRAAALTYLARVLRHVGLLLALVLAAEGARQVAN